MPTDKPVDEILRALQERAKELSCLYQVDEILNQKEIERDTALQRLTEVIPPGWQYPQLCTTRLMVEDRPYEPTEFKETPWVMAAPIPCEGETIGELQVYYTKRMPDLDEGPFLKEERRLIDAIAERIGRFLMHQRLTRALAPRPHADSRSDKDAEEKWGVVLEFLAVRTVRCSLASPGG